MSKRPHNVDDRMADDEATPESLSGDDRDNQTVFFQADDVDRVGSEEDLDVPIDEGDLVSEGGQYGVVRLESLTDLELRDGETDDADIAAEEGLTYIAPMDPPIRVGGELERIEVASGFGSTSLDDPFDESHHDEMLYGEDEVSARVRDALRADAATSEFADQIHVVTIGGRVILRGVVDTIEDTDDAAAVAEQVEGVTEVEDRMRVRGL
jgi:hypothetical protein